MLRKTTIMVKFGEMRISSITDLIYQKFFRTKQIGDKPRKTVASEGID